MPIKTTGLAIVSFAEARRIMADNLKDPDLRQGYIDNIAMRMHDELHERGYKPKLKHDDRNQIAENLLELIFEG